MEAMPVNYEHVPETPLSIPSIAALLERAKHYDLDPVNGVWIEKWRGRWCVWVRHTCTGPIFASAADAVAWCDSDEGRGHMAPLLRPGYNGIKYGK